MEVAHEADAAMPPLPESPDDALGALRSAGIDRGVVGLSSALGVERLPADEAREVLDAWHADAAELPPQLGAWGALALRDPDPVDVDRALRDGGCVGVSVPATELADPAALDRLGPVLECLERRDGVLFVHPGPAAAGDWQPALTSYPASLLAAWLAWVAHGRAQHPRLRVLFAALAGLGPLHAERIAARGGPELERDDLTFFDTSSYGPRAAAAMAETVGASQVVYGSDHPWAGGRDQHSAHADAVSGVNAERLLAGVAS